MHVLVTGASGVIGRHVLQQLNAMQNVARISCLVVRQKSFDGLRSKSLSKVDLTSSSLDLSAADFQAMSQAADVILHCGSDRSFWNPYRLLRAANVIWTKELVRLAAPRKTISRRVLSISQKSPNTSAKWDYSSVNDSDTKIYPPRPQYHSPELQTCPAHFARRYDEYMCSRQKTDKLTQNCTIITIPSQHVYMGLSLRCWER